MREAVLGKPAPVKLTVLIDTYNYGRFIEQAIDSVLRQDFPRDSMEILVVDDGSSDNTAATVQKYGDRIQFFCKPNGGQASTLNFGITRARGEIVALLDGDDYWLPAKLTRIAAEFEKNPEAGMVYHNFYEKHEPKTELLLNTIVAGQSGFLSRNPKALLNYDLFSTATLAFRRRVLERLLPIPEALVVQADAHLSACVVFLAPVVYVDEPLAVYRVHVDNAWNWAGNTPAGGNIFRGDAAARARLERRVLTTRAISVGVRQWLEMNGFDLRQPEIETFAGQWEVAARTAEFALSPPGRLRFLHYLLFEQPRTRMTWRHLMVHYANAFGALFVGYRNYHRLDDWRLALKRAARLFRPI